MNQQQTAPQQLELPLEDSTQQPQQAESPRAESQQAESQQPQPRSVDVAGRVDPAIQQLQQQLRERDDQIQQLYQLLANMQQLSQQADKQLQQAEQPKVSLDELITSADVELFGDDMVQFIKRVMGRVIDDILARLQAVEQRLETEVKAPLNEVVESTKLTKQQQFVRTMDSAVPDWRSVDADPAFIAWVRESPARLQLLQQAANAFDAEAVIGLMQQWKALQAVVQQPQPQQSSAAQQLEQQVAPAPSAPSAPVPNAGNSGKMWKVSEISEFYRTGKKHMTKEQAAAVEADIFAAQREGRVIPG